MRIVLAPDKFRGTATAQEVCDALAAVLTSQGHEVAEVPMADGGEGTLEALGGANRTTVVTGPLGDPVEAQWRLSGRRAVIESARASGLALVGGAEGNDAVAASTYGTGELIATALDLGATDVVVGVGGSASTDGGLGALRAMAPLHRLRGVRLTVACDVAIGFLDAADVFAPQKGASPAQVELLRRRLERLAQVYVEDHGVDVTGLECAGAAGGLAGGLACAGAELVHGFDVVSERVGLEEALEDADLVVTGEGFLDAESFDGKVVGGVAELAGSMGVPVVAVVGRCFDGAEDRLPTISLVDRFGEERAMDDTLAALGEVASEVVDLAVRDHG